MQTLRMRVIHVGPPVVHAGNRMVHYDNGLSVLVPRGRSGWQAAVNDGQHPTHWNHRSNFGLYSWVEDALVLMERIT